MNPSRRSGPGPILPHPTWISISLAVFFSVFLPAGCLPPLKVNLQVNSLTETAPPALNDPSIPDTAAVMAYLASTAKERLDITAPYFNADCSPLLVNAIRLAARRGVKVRILADDSQSARRSIYRLNLDLLPGVETVFFDIKPYGRRPWGTVHAKYMLVDSRYACLGSANFSRPALFNNREINVYTSDPTVVGQLRDIFENDLLIAGFRPAQTNILFYKDQNHRVSFNTDRPYQLIESAPWQFDNPEILNILDVLTNLIQRAEHSIKGEIYLYTAAFTNSPYIEKNILEAGKRGVEIQLIANKDTYIETDDYGVPQYPEYRLALARAYSNRVGIRLIETKKLFPSGEFSTTHAKVLIVDDRFLVVQSANWAASSVYDNREVGIFTKDPAMVGQMLRIFGRDWDFSEDFKP